jgi:hypothetical protein
MYACVYLRSMLYAYVYLRSMCTFVTSSKLHFTQRDKATACMCVWYVCMYARTYACIMYIFMTSLRWNVSQHCECSSTDVHVVLYNVM